MSDNYGFLNFAEISAAVEWKELLNHLNLTYTEDKDELKGQSGKGWNFIISLAKGQFFSPTNRSLRGGPVNFLQAVSGKGLREAAHYLKTTFMKPPATEVQEEEKKVPAYVLDFEHPAVKALNLTPEDCERYECGYVKTGMMKGRVSFLIRDLAGDPAGWIGYRQDAKIQWLFPSEKYYTHKHVWGLHRLEDRAPAFLTASIPEAIHIDRFFPNQALALVSDKINEEQALILAMARSIVVLFPNPDYICTKLARRSFVLAPRIQKPVLQMSKDELEKLL